MIEAVQSMVPDVVAVYLFGSAAQGTQAPESDLDLAILAKEPLPETLRWELQERLAGLVRRDVDLVDLRSATTVMRAQVFSSDILLFESDPNERGFFEMVALSMYADLNETRAGIVGDAIERGTVYG